MRQGKAKLKTLDTGHETIKVKQKTQATPTGRLSQGNELEYRGVINDFVSWCEQNHLRISASKTKELVLDFSKKLPPITPVNIEGLEN